MTRKITLQNTFANLCFHLGEPLVPDLLLRGEGGIQFQVPFVHLAQPGHIAPQAGTRIVLGHGGGPEHPFPLAAVHPRAASRRAEQLFL